MAVSLGDPRGMRDDELEEQGQHLHNEVELERQAAGGVHRWRCSAELRARVETLPGTS
jgi:hypothetical protein